MARRRTIAELRVRIAFDAARIAPQCLADAYERLVPIPCRPTRPVVRRETLPDLVAAPDLPLRRRAEHE